MQTATLSRRAAIKRVASSTAAITAGAPATTALASTATDDPVLPHAPRRPAKVFAHLDQPDHNPTVSRGKAMAESRNTTNPPKIDTIKSTDCESVAGLKFDAVDITELAAKGRGTLDEWLDKAQDDFITFGLCLRTIKFDDDQLFERIRKAEAEDGDEALHRYVDLIEVFNDQKDKHEAIAETYQAAFARLFIAMERHCERAAS